MDKWEYQSAKSFVETMTPNKMLKQMLLSGLFIGVINLLSFHYLGISKSDTSLFGYAFSKSGLLSFIVSFLSGVLIPWFSHWSTKKAVQKWKKNNHMLNT